MLPFFQVPWAYFALPFSPVPWAYFVLPFSLVPWAYFVLPFSPVPWAYFALIWPHVSATGFQASKIFDQPNYKEIKYAKMLVINGY